MRGELLVGHGPKVGLRCDPSRLPDEDAFRPSLRPPFKPRILRAAEELLKRRSLLGSGPEQVDRALLDGGDRLLAVDVECVLTLKGDRRDGAEQPKARRHGIKSVRIGILAGELMHLASTVDHAKAPQG